jgi:hypothetical protein
MDFCYWCGTRFTEVEELRNEPDHLPPKASFDSSDRNFPLKVACHRKCNIERSVADKKSAQVIGGLRGEFPNSTRDIAIKVAPYQFPNQPTPTGVLLNTNWHEEIWRWIRGFHAALYRDFLPADSPHRVYTPFPSGYMREGIPVLVDDTLCDQAMLSTSVKHNRDLDNFDQILCNNGKLQYICVWAKDDASIEWHCEFALQLYDWKRIGDPNYPHRGCVGRYSLSNGGMPIDASVATTLAATTLDSVPLDVFSV